MRYSPWADYPHGGRICLAWCLLLSQGKSRDGVIYNRAPGGGLHKPYLV